MTRDEAAATNGEMSVPARVLRWADRVPDQIAVEHLGTTLTYEDLVRQAERVRRDLVKHGVRPGDRVALLLDRSAELVIATLGTLLAGAAYVGLDVREPCARLTTMLADAGDPVVLTDDSGAAMLPRGTVAVPVAVVRSATSPPTECDPPPDQPCYITYTSGSTGTPKGVEVTHRGAANLVTWYRKTFDVAPGDRMPQFARPSFDGWSLEVWPCLANGATLCVPDERTVRSADVLARWLCDQRITTAFVTTALGVELFAQDWSNLTPTPQRLLIGGEKLRDYPPPLPFDVYNVYGPTETAMLATCARLAEAGADAGDPPIGRPLAGVHAHVLDTLLDQVPMGEVGELYLGGAGVAVGYLGRPGLTATRFVADPFTPGPGRLYRTGDLVRALADGSLEFVGRADKQVKLRGFRIELGEVESAAAALPGVLDAVAVVHQPPSGLGRLVVHVRPEPNLPAPLAPASLRAALATVLPDYMTPVVQVTATFPLNPHGKVDRAALAGRAPVVTDVADVPAEATDAPLTDLERLLADLWCDVLAVTAARRTDSFFELGGDSLAAMRVAAKARSRGLLLGAEDLFEHEFLGELAAAIEVDGTRP